MDIVEAILNGILWLLRPVFWLLSLIWKLICDVASNAYGKVVAILGTLVVLYLISLLLRK